MGGALLGGVVDIGVGHPYIRPILGWPTPI